ncbi:hypothetical protein ACQ4LE_006375 [Meloidogyne hapla]
MHPAEGKTQKKEISLIKSSEIIGITLCNDDGQVVIRHIAPGSIAADASHAIRKGDAIEKINGELMTGKSHREVAAKLRFIALGSNFQLRLSSPRSNNGKSYKRFDPNVNNGGLQNEPMGGQSKVESQITEYGLKDRINSLLSEYYGFERDEDLIYLVWQLLISSYTLATFNEKMSVNLHVLEVPEQVCEKIWNEISPEMRRVVTSSKLLA